jgi:hypothetical protein
MRVHATFHRQLATLAEVTSLAGGDHIIISGRVLTILEQVLGLDMINGKLPQGRSGGSFKVAVAALEKIPREYNSTADPFAVNSRELLPFRNPIRPHHD